LYVSDTELFTAEERNNISDRILEIARSDSHIVGAAVIGSLALDEEDRYSDLDLTFAIQESADPSLILARMTAPLVEEFGAIPLFDLPSGDTLFRVLLLRGCLQVDLSVTPEASFASYGHKFRLLYGNALAKPYVPSPPATQLFGYAVHHALRSRFCIERNRLLQAEYWISGVRDYALNLACLARELPAYYGRGYDQLPEDVKNSASKALVRSLDRSELLRALSAVITLLLAEAPQVVDVPETIQAQLDLLTRLWPSA
jgi:predicted nucleotidyltransferase